MFAIFSMLQKYLGGNKRQIFFDPINKFFLRRKTLLFQFLLIKDLTKCQTQNQFGQKDFALWKCKYCNTVLSVYWPNCVGYVTVCQTKEAKVNISGKIHFLFWAGKTVILGAVRIFSQTHPKPTQSPISTLWDFRPDQTAMFAMCSMWTTP